MGSAGGEAGSTPKGTSSGGSSTTMIAGAVFVVLLLGGGGFFFMQQKKEAEAEAAKPKIRTANAKSAEPSHFKKKEKKARKADWWSSGKKWDGGGKKANFAKGFEAEDDSDEPPEDDGKWRRDVDYHLDKEIPAELNGQDIDFSQFQKEEKEELRLAPDGQYYPKEH